MAAAGVSFDHFLNDFGKKLKDSEIQFQVLKPNEINKLNDINNEEGKIKAYGLPHNVICIKQLLSEKQQIALVNLSNDLYPSLQLEISPFPQHTPWIYYNWPKKFMEKADIENEIKNNKQKKKQMELLLNLGAILGKMIISIANSARQQKANGKQDINNINEEKHNIIDNNNEKNQHTYSPKAIYGILYPSRGFLEAHEDAHQGWIVSISVGATCDFWFCDHKNDNDKRKYHLNIESGDVMVFPGYRLMHGVDNVDQNVPGFWKILQETHVIPLQFARYCLQFRHPLK
eukprot:176158_1